MRAQLTDAGAVGPATQDVELHLRMRLHDGGRAFRDVVTRSRVRAAAWTVAMALIALCAGALLPALGRTAAATECPDLVGLKLDHATVSSAEPIDNGVFGADNTAHPPTAGYSGLPAFCREIGRAHV